MSRAAAFAPWAGRLTLAAIFFYTGGTKVMDPVGFATDIDNYRLLPPALVGVAAVGLPVLELVVGVALLTPRYVAGAAVLSALMLCLFAGGMAQARLRGIDLDCGCFGAAGDSPVSWNKVAIDVGLAILSMWVAWACRPRSEGAQPAPEVATSP
jgi:uncharacterized membrane protein YphA (DoxX/SURF4 family)